MRHSIIFSIGMAELGVTMRTKTTTKSLMLVFLMVMSTMIGIVNIPSAMAVNETTSGTISGTETWTGTMNLVGDIEVAEGSKLIINSGTTINIPYGKFIDVRGAICIGDSNCGASAGTSKARFIWQQPTDYTKLGRCYSNQTGSPLNNGDTACGSGMIIRSTIDEAITSINNAHFEKAYGYPIYIQSLQSIQYGVLVFDGSRVTASGLSFTDVNTSNVLAVNGAAPTLDNSQFTIGIDGRGYDAAAVRAYSAGISIQNTINVFNSQFTGDASKDCGTQGGGRSLVFIEDSYVSMDNIDIGSNTYGIFLKRTSGVLGNSSIVTKCNAIDTNDVKTTGEVRHRLRLYDNTITTTEGAGLTAYDGANVLAVGNTISGAEQGSGVGIRSSEVTLERNTIGPIGGWNGIWVYGESDVVAENNTIQDTAKEPVLIGEYHFNDQGWSVPRPTEARLYLANNVISNNTGTCNSVEYDGDFACPAVHVFMSSATIMGNTISNSNGDIIRSRGGIVNVQDNTGVSSGGYAGNISHFDDNNGMKYGSIAYFSGNSWSNVSQVYNVTQSRVTVQSEQMPSPGFGAQYPVMVQWLGAECPYVQNECLNVPLTANMPPKYMPLALELLNNASVFAFADVQNFDETMIHVQNQNTEWGTQIQKGELVRYQVKAKNSNVYDATVVIKDATGLPIFNMQTDVFGFTPQVSLPSDFLLDRNWNHVVGDVNYVIPGTSPPQTGDAENSCADGIDNDGDTVIDEADPDCLNGREKPFYSVEAFKFEKGRKSFSYILSGPVDDVINLDNLRPGVSVDQADGTSFATIATITGESWDGVKWPYANDNTAYEKQFGLIHDIEIQPPDSQDWYSAIDTSGVSEITQENHPFKTWSFDWDLSAHPGGEEDVTFRIRSFDGLEYSPVQVRDFKLNLVPPTILVETPNDGSTHDSGVVTFTGTSFDPYSGVQGNDIQQIWFDITGPNDYQSHFFSEGGPSWEYDWDFNELPSGSYDFKIWAADSDFCIDDPGPCMPETRTLNIINENQAPFVQVTWIGAQDMSTGGLNMGVIRASQDTVIQGVAVDNDGAVSRVDIEVYDLASGSAFPMNNGPLPVTSFAPNGAWSAVWDTSRLIHDQQYEVVVKAYDSDKYSKEERLRIIINNPADASNIDPVFNETGWKNTITIFCDEKSKSFDRCGGGARINLAQFFSDPDGIGTSVEALEFDVYDDASTSEDDLYYAYVIIDANGYATYNPASSIASTTSVIADWSLDSVIFVAEDKHEAKVYSNRVDFLVRAISFKVEREDSGLVTEDDNAVFIGEGLPGSTVVARFTNGDLRVNATVVEPDGTWRMEVSSQQLGVDGKKEIYFEMDDQEFKFEGESQVADFGLSVSTGAEAGSSVMMIILIILGVIVLLGIGAYFFIEFEEEFDEEVLQDGAQEVEEDPYAWAKKKQYDAVEIPPAGTAQEPQVQQEQQPQQVSQHPGWLWDAANNQWVPDPNYQQPQQ